MRDYMLFVDTETSGIPENWNAPYSMDEAWPHVVQIAWAVFTKDGVEVKSENHYIRADGFHIDQESMKIHGITEDFLNEKGEGRADVFHSLARDLEKYRPLIVGHFVEFDHHMMEMGFRRSGMDYVGRDLPRFCTMLAGRKYGSRLYIPRSLRLDELYMHLFQRRLENHHNALIDAKATADCFFEMLKKGDITTDSIAAQSFPPVKKGNYTLLWIFIFIIIVAITIIAC